MSPRLLATCFCLLSVLPAMSRAQDPAVRAGPRAPEFPTLRDSQWVRLSSTGIPRHEGRVLEHAGGDLVVSAERQPLRIQATSIDTLWTRGHSAKQGAIIGSVGGAVAGVALALLYGGSTTEHDFSTGQAALLAGGVGAAGGALIGTLFGLSLPRWQRRIP
jgi:hypothetical protein